jgi:hypothetical protein
MPRWWRCVCPASTQIDVALPALLNDLSGTDAKQTLILDDYRLLTDARIYEAVEYLLSYLPPSLRLVIAGRLDPPLPLARMRARGELTEIRAGYRYHRLFRDFCAASSKRPLPRMSADYCGEPRIGIWRLGRPRTRSACGSLRAIGSRPLRCCLPPRTTLLSRAWPRRSCGWATSLAMRPYARIRGSP